MQNEFVQYEDEEDGNGECPCPSFLEPHEQVDDDEWVDRLNECKRRRSDDPEDYETDEEYYPANDIGDPDDPRLD